VALEVALSMGDGADNAPGTGLRSLYSADRGVVKQQALARSSAERPGTRVPDPASGLPKQTGEGA